MQWCGASASHAYTDDQYVEVLLFHISWLPASVDEEETDAIQTAGGASNSSGEGLEQPVPTGMPVGTAAVKALRGA